MSRLFGFIVFLFVGGVFALAIALTRSSNALVGERRPVVYVAEDSVHRATIYWTAHGQPAIAPWPKQKKLVMPEVCHFDERGLCMLDSLPAVLP